MIEHARGRHIHCICICGSLRFGSWFVFSAKLIRYADETKSMELSLMLLIFCRGNVII